MLAAESTYKAQEPSLATQNEVVDKLKQGLDQMRSKLGELTAKRNELVNRSRVAAGPVPGPRRAQSPGRWRSNLGDRPVRGNIRRQEATVRGQQEFAASSLEAQFASLEDLGEQTEVEARLAALKSIDRKAIDY